MTKKVLVTGGTGFIGRHAVADLKARGFDVYVTTSGTTVQSEDGVNYVRCDLTDRDQTASVVAEIQADHLLHIAWRAAVSGLWNAPENHQWLMSSIALAEAFIAAGGQRITVCGTCGEYDWTNGLCIEDVTPLRPNTVYGQCKVSLLHALSAICKINDIPLAWGRPFFVYGPNEHPSRLGADVILSLLNGKEALCSHGMQLRDYAHAADVGSGLSALSASSLSGEYNLSTGVAIRVRDMIEEIGRQLDRADLIRLNAREAPAFEPPLILADMIKVRQSGLDWSPKFDLETGVADTIEQFRKA